MFRLPSGNDDGSSPERLQTRSSIISLWNYVVIASLILFLLIVKIISYISYSAMTTCKLSVIESSWATAWNISSNVTPFYIFDGVTYLQHSRLSALSSYTSLSTWYCIYNVSIFGSKSKFWRFNLFSLHLFSRVNVNIAWDLEECWFIPVDFVWRFFLTNEN